MEETHLTSLLENLPGMAYRCDNNREWTMRYVSAGAYDLTGYHPEDLIESRKVAYADLIHPEDRPSVWMRVQETLSGNRPFEMEYRIGTASGQEKWVWERGRPVHGETGSVEAIEGFVTDISVQRMTVDALARNRQFMNTIVTEVQAVIFSFDSGGIFTFSDGKGLQALGLKPGQVVGLSVFDVYADLPDIKESCHRALSGEIVRSKGMEIGPLYLDTIYQPVFDASGKVCSVVGIAVDVTELRKQQNAIAWALEEVNRSNRELEQFAYVASHDLQEPLRMVSSFTQLLSWKYGGQLDDKARKYIEYAVDGAIRMQRLINDLLTYSRINTQGGSPSRTDAGRVLGEALRNLSSAINESGAVISSGTLPDVEVDPTQLMQLFQNLISNAIKFHSEEVPEITVAARDAGAEWLFSVKDNGIGIDPKYADRIFVIFQRLHTRREYPGTGVGLAVCKRIVERHGGKIWYESSGESGTTFCFTFRK